MFCVLNFHSDRLRTKGKKFRPHKYFPLCGSLVSPRIHVAMVARALSMLAFTAEKVTWCVRSFCLVKSSYENLSRYMHHIIKSFQAFLPLSYCKQQSWVWRPGNEATVGPLTTLLCCRFRKTLAPLLEHLLVIMILQNG